MFVSVLPPWEATGDSMQVLKITFANSHAVNLGLALHMLKLSYQTQFHCANALPAARIQIIAMEIPATGAIQSHAMPRRPSGIAQVIDVPIADAPGPLPSPR